MSPPLDAWLLIVHVVLDVAVALGGLLIGRRGRSWIVARPSATRLGAALSATAIASATSIFLGWWKWDVGLFGAIHLLFGDLLITAPVFGVALLAGVVATRGPARLWLAPVALASIAAGGCAAWGHWVEPFRLRLESPVVEAGGLDRELRIAVLADLQTEAPGAYEESAIDILLATQPDLIVIPGDLFQGTNPRFERELPRLHALLERLDAPLGVIAVLGNSDRPRRFARSVAGTRIRWLHNELYRIPCGGAEIVIGGLGWSPSVAARAAMEALAEVPAEGTLRLLLLHDPGVLYATDRSFDLAIAGHTHGGQVNLPLLGPVLTLSELPARYARGLHEVRGTMLYVSRGVGLERGQAPRVRFLCPPEVTLLTVRPSWKYRPTPP